MHFVNEDFAGNQRAWIHEEREPADDGRLQIEQQIFVFQDRCDQRLMIVAKSREPREVVPGLGAPPLLRGHAWLSLEAKDARALADFIKPKEAEPTEWRHPATAPKGDQERVLGWVQFWLENTDTKAPSHVFGRKQLAVCYHAWGCWYVEGGDGGPQQVRLLGWRPLPDEPGPQEIPWD